MLLRRLKIKRELKRMQKVENVYTIFTVPNTFSQQMIAPIFKQASF